MTVSIIFAENCGLIFLKWTTRNGWSDIGNNSRSNLEHTIFIFIKNTQRLHGTLSYVRPQFYPEEVVFAQL